jgi:hypothetical protein
VRRLAIGVGLFLMCGTVPVLGRQAGTPAPSPTSTGTADKLRVFLDCPMCDDEYLRQNVGFVDYVRDRAVADVHVLVTTQSTGGGGLRWVVQFIGLGRFQSQSLSLAFDTSSTATSDDRRLAFARVFKLGLAGPAATTSVGPQLGVTWTAPENPHAATADRWNNWVFNVNLNGFTNGERSSSSRSMYLSLSANRTTERWKANASTYGNLSNNAFRIDGQPEISTRTHSWGVDGLVVRSLGARWSAGAVGSTSHSSYSNVDRAISVAPVIEFDVFPYAESSRRSLTVGYAVGAVLYKYAEVTIFDKVRERVPRHEVSANLSLTQPWGSLSLTSNFSQHLTHRDRYHEAVSGEADVRLFKGFSFNVYLQYDRIKDQISLRKSAVSEADILLHVQQLATGYSYYANFGITYRFGSIFNNTVNTRLNHSGF